jgi:hypothetical protein
MGAGSRGSCARELTWSKAAHVETPTPVTALGARGVGEAGTVAAGAAVWTAGEYEAALAEAGVEDNWNMHDVTPWD